MCTKVALTASAGLRIAHPVGESTVRLRAILPALGLLCTVGIVCLGTA